MKKSEIRLKSENVHPCFIILPAVPLLSHCGSRWFGYVSVKYLDDRPSPRVRLALSRQTQGFHRSFPPAHQ